jgi:hypothetical protein
MLGLRRTELRWAISPADHRAMRGESIAGSTPPPGLAYEFRDQSPSHRFGVTMKIVIEYCVQ